VIQRALHVRDCTIKRPKYLISSTNFTLPIPGYKLCATVQGCMQHKAPQYMTDCCIHTSDIARRQHLRSAGCHQLFVPRHRRSMFGRRAFSVAGPAAWNSLPELPARSVTFLWQFSSGPENFAFLVSLAYTAHKRLCDYA